MNSNTLNRKKYFIMNFEYIYKSDNIKLWEEWLTVIISRITRPSSLRMRIIRDVLTWQCHEFGILRELPTQTCNHLQITHILHQELVILQSTLVGPHILKQLLLISIPPSVILIPEARVIIWINSIIKIGSSLVWLGFVACFFFCGHSIENLVFLEKKSYRVSLSEHSFQQDPSRAIATFPFNLHRFC